MYKIIFIIQKLVYFNLEKENKLVKMLDDLDIKERL